MKKNSRIIRWLPLFSLFFLAPAHSEVQENFNTANSSGAAFSPAQPEVWVNVFIHGIFSINPYSTLTNVLRFLNDNLLDSPYGETVATIRSDPFFFQNQAMQGLGLQPIDVQNYKTGNAAALLAHIFEQADALNSPATHQNYYYTYGWSALLSKSARYKDAKQLVLELNNLMLEFRQKGITPKIRLLGFSHGGTLILKLALVKCLEQLPFYFSVDQTFLIGTPIQFDTDYLINDPLFKSVYNIFSRSDRAQNLDFFSCGHFFSSKVFSPHCGFEELPSKLIQLDIRLLRKKGEACKPYTLCDATQPLLFDGRKCKKSVRNVSPGHTELWFFGWTPLNYRKTFPFYPLPVVAFLPFIANAIAPIAHNTIPERPITVTIDPRRDSMIFTIPHCKQVFCGNFVGIQNFLALKQEALLYQPHPDIYNWNVFNLQIQANYQKALKALKERKCYNKISACGCK